jgi:hypothetical protein
MMKRRFSLLNLLPGVRPRQSCIYLVTLMAVTFGLGPAVAGTITLTSNYNDITSLQQITGGTGSVTVLPVGIPPSSLTFQTVRNPTSVQTKVRGFEECGSCVIDPSFDGSITSVTFSINVAVTSFQNTTGSVGFEWLVYQSGNIYTHSGFAFETPDALSPPTTYSGTFTASDFHQIVNEVGPPDGSNPFFDAGSPLVSFGFLISNGASPFSGIPAIINGTIRDFVVTATTEPVAVPEPTSILLLTTAMVLAHSCRRLSQRAPR